MVGAIDDAAISNAAIKLTKAAAGWIVTNTKSEMRHNVVSYYKHSSTELDALDRRIGHFIVTPFQRGCAVDGVDERCTWEKKSSCLELLQDEYKLVFMIMKLVLSYDERVKAQYKMGKAKNTLVHKINRKLSFYKNVSKKKLADVEYKSVDEYIKIWGEADKVFIGLFKVIPRRHMILKQHKAYDEREEPEQAETGFEFYTYKVLQHDTMLAHEGAEHDSRRAICEELLRKEQTLISSV